MEYHKIIEIAFLTVAISTGILWLITAIQYNRIRLGFLREFPIEAQKYVTPWGQMSPKNVTFLFEKESMLVLKLHPKLWPMRQNALRLSIASITRPILCMVILSIVLSITG